MINQETAMNQNLKIQQMTMCFEEPLSQFPLFRFQTVRVQLLIDIY
jgi:hypothetical protein